MQYNGRRVLYDEARVRQMFGRMREELHEMAARHVSEVAALRQELDQVRAQFDELRSISLARQRAEAKLAALYRERSIARARAAQRDPGQPLN